VFCGVLTSSTLLRNTCKEAKGEVEEGAVWFIWAEYLFAGHWSIKEISVARSNKLAKIVDFVT
jgi:hypothetical protein